MIVWEWGTPAVYLITTYFTFHRESCSERRYCKTAQNDIGHHRFWRSYPWIGGYFIEDLGIKYPIVYHRRFSRLYSGKDSQDMDGPLTLIFAYSETTWNFKTKISALLQPIEIWNFTKFEGCSSKIGASKPIWSFRKTNFWHLEPSSVNTKWCFIEVINWWKFCIDISNDIWVIQNWLFSIFQVSPSRYENTFQKGFWYHLGDTEKDEIFQFWISQNWLKISTPNFYQLSTSMKIRYLQKIEVIGAQNLDFLPKM